MEAKKKINVSFRFSEKEIPVGQMVLDGKDVLFKYHNEYLSKGWNISPLKLSFDDSLQVSSPSPFDGLFGVFSDSLPDAWGQLLTRRLLSQKGITIQQLSTLDRLALLSDNTSGALIYRPTEDQIGQDPTSIDLDAINKSVQGVLEGESTEIIDQLFQMGGSSGGARPKIYAGYDPRDNQLMFGNDSLPENFQHWIVKFAAKVDTPDIANIEMAYYEMARAANMEMTESQLLTGKSGKNYFATQRFDRINNDRLHMISAAGIFHDDFERSQMDYGTLMHEAYNLMNNHSVLEEILRRTAFNVFAHNRDDHSKNFAFLMDSSGRWRFAPAYDLTFSSSSHGMHSTTCSGNATNPGIKELMELAKHFSIRKADRIIQEVKEVIKEWPHFANMHGVSSTSIRNISNRLQQIA
ncbi:MAG: type II toxin-antitoxin system HipA family toxin [Crocinitomicaceae bacterium]